MSEYSGWDYMADVSELLRVKPTDADRREAIDENGAQSLADCREIRRLQQRDRQLAILETAPETPRDRAVLALRLLCTARDHFKMVDNKRTLQRIRDAISSAKGAIRIQDLRASRRREEAVGQEISR